MPDIDVGSNLPSRSVPRSRPYSNVAFDPSTGLIVAASAVPEEFAMFDEDNNKLWEPDGEQNPGICTVYSCRNHSPPL